jgi:uncharacterized protein (DUF2141 family)
VSKHFPVFAFFAASMWASAVAAEPPPGAVGALQVVVSGFRSAEGEVAIALFGTSEDYEQQSNAVREAWLDVDGEEVVWSVPDLPPGYYAVVAFHDENGNRELDVRFFGLPKEPFGFSNDARGMFGPPRFDAAKFEIRADGMVRQHVRLR